MKRSATTPSAAEVSRKTRALFPGPCGEGKRRTAGLVDRLPYHEVRGCQLDEIAHQGLKVPEELEAEGQKLVEIILSKNERVVNLTKYCVKKGADLDWHNVMAFEGVPQRLPIKEAIGIADFVETDTRNKRRELLDGFWFD